MVASQYAQAPGVDAQAFGLAEFRREVGDLHPAVAVVFAKPGWAVQVVFELFENLLNAIDALFIGDECFEMPGAQRGQKAQRCSFAGDPGLRIEFFERAGRLLFPTPSQVVGQIPQWGDFLGQGRKEVEAKQWLHYAIFSHGLTKEALTKAGMSKTIAKKTARREAVFWPIILKEKRRARFYQVVQILR